MNNIKPLDNRVLIKRDESETRTAGGLFIPETSITKTQKGIVLELGNGLPLPNGDCQSFSVKKGDRVLFMSGGCIEIGGSENLVLMPETNIYCIITEKEEK